MATTTSLILAELKARLENAFPSLSASGDVRFGSVDTIADNKNSIVSIMPITEVLDYQSSARYNSTLQIDISIINRSNTHIFDCEAMREKLHKAIVAEPKNLNGTCQSIRHSETKWAYADGSIPIAELKATYAIKYTQNYQTLN